MGTSVIFVKEYIIFALNYTGKTAAKNMPLLILLRSNIFNQLWKRSSLV